jgi:hypothetical protein
VWVTTRGKKVYLGEALVTGVRACGSSLFVDSRPGRPHRATLATEKPAAPQAATTQKRLIDLVGVLEWLHLRMDAGVEVRESPLS